MTKDEFNNLEIGNKIYLSDNDNWGTVEIVEITPRFGKMVRIIGIRWLETYDKDQPEIDDWGAFCDGDGYYVAKNAKEELLIKLKFYDEMNKND